jgi:hypothetical protein
MAKILFSHGWTLENHPSSTIIHFYKKEALVGGLAAMVADWRQAAGSRPLTEVKASVGLMLADFAGLLDLTPEETEQLLGLKV